MNFNRKKTYIIRSGLNLGIQPMLIFIPKRWIAHQQDVQNDAARPNVHRLAIRLLLEHLGRQIAGRTSESEPRLLIPLHLNRQPKVGQLDGGAFRLRRQQQVLRLEVAMHHAVRVTMVHRLQDLLDAMGGVRFRVEFARHDVLEEFAAGDAGGRID